MGVEEEWGWTEFIGKQPRRLSLDHLA